MDSYTKYLMFIGLFVTVVTIILFFIMYNYSDSVSEWPPKSNRCPDYWTKKLSDDGITCYDTLRLSPNDDDGAVFNPNTVVKQGTARGNALNSVDAQEWGGIPLNGNSIEYNSENATTTNDTASYNRVDINEDPIGFGTAGQWRTHCGKKKWANDNGITWDGISNSNIDCSSYLGASGSNETIFNT